MGYVCPSEAHLFWAREISSRPVRNRLSFSVASQRRPPPHCPPPPGSAGLIIGLLPANHRACRASFDIA